MSPQSSSAMSTGFLLGSEQPFAGKCVWVTGAASGIGLAIAQSFSRLGAQLVALDRQFTPVQEPVEYERVILDITDQQQIADVSSRLLVGGLAPHILVNAAGVLRMGKLDSQATDGLSIADWQACFDVNVSGVFYLLRTLIPHFKQQGSGSIVNLASNAAHVPRINMGAYCASKAALASLSHCVALELAEYGVRCNLVSPGSTDTPMLRSMLGDADAGQGAELFAPTIRGLPDQYKLGIPLKKVATAQEIANTVVFLASDLASHITMQDLVVDGGATLAA